MSASKSTPVDRGLDDVSESLSSSERTQNNILPQRRQLLKDRIALIQSSRRFPSVKAQKPLDELHSEIIRCTKCRLAKTRTRAVPGEGSMNARLMFIGEGPGRTEDQKGRPFVGRAGKLLDEMLEEIGVKRSEVFITNVVKCRPVSPEGRDRKPSEDEISTCTPLYLEKQIDIITPTVICTLGDTATACVLHKHGLEPGMISKIHGSTFITHRFKIMPMYHPAAALYTNELKEAIQRDFERLEALLKQSSLESFRS